MSLAFAELDVGGCSLRAACLGENSLLPLFAKGEVSQELRDFIVACESSVPEGDGSIDSRWEIAKASPTSSIGLASDMAVADLGTNKLPIARGILPFLKTVGESKEMSDAEAKNFCFQVLQLRHMNTSLFYSLRPAYANVLVNVGMGRAIEAIGPEVLAFLLEPHLDFFKTWNKADAKNIGSIFNAMYPILFESVELSQMLQEKGARDSQFPQPFMNNNDVSLANTALLRGGHFFDVYAKEVENFFVKGNFMGVPQEVEKFEEFLPFFVVIHQPILYSDIFNAQGILNDRDWSGTVAEETISRMKNDCLLLYNCQDVTEQEIQPKNLIQKSLPFVYQHCLNNEGVLNYSDLKFFLIEDAAAETDFNFMRYYRAISIFLTFFQNPGKHIHEKLEEIKKMIDGVGNIAFRSYLILDLFSCIFLKQNDKFLCHPNAARGLMRLLEVYNAEVKTEYISGAYAKLETKRKKKNKSEVTLEDYFDANHNEIYQAIHEKKWDLANQLTRYLPYFRKLYKRAALRNALVSGLPPPEDTASEDKNVKLEISLSSFQPSMFKGTVKYFPEYKSIVAERQRCASEADVLTWMKDPSKWIAVGKAVAEFESDPYESVASETRKNLIANLALAKQVTRFVSTLVPYFKAIALSGTQDNLEEMFRFNIQKVLAGPFNIGDFQTASQMAQLYHTDLFEYVIKHTSAFKITEEYVDTMIETHPLELTMMCYALGYYDVIEKNKAKLDEKTVKYIKQLMRPQKKQPHTATPTSKILEMVASRHIEDIDDYIFDCDTYELYYKLLKTESNNYSDAMIYALDLCSFSAKSSQEIKKENQIRFMNKVRKITSETNQNHIIADLMKHSGFEMVVSYIKTMIQPEQWSAPVCQLFSLCINDEEKVIAVLQAFPSCYDTLSLRFFHFPGIAPHFLRYGPPEKRELIEAFSQLPEDVATESNIFEISTVVASFARHPECIFKITPRTAAFFDDSQLLEMLDPVENINSFCKLSTFLYQFFKDKSMIGQLWSKKMTEHIRVLDVQSVSEEQECIKFFKKAQPLQELFQADAANSRKIECLRTFVEKRMFLHYNVSYSFFDYGTDAFPARILGICYTHNLEDIAKLVTEAFSVKPTASILNRTEMLLTEGLFAETKALFKGTSKVLELSDVSKFEEHKACSCLTNLTKMSVFNCSDIRSLCKQFPVSDSDVDKLMLRYVYQRIKTITKFTSDKEREQIYAHLLLHGVSRRTAISMLVYGSRFEQAYQLLMDIKDTGQREEAFIYDFYYPAITRGMNKLESFFKRKDPSLSATNSLWDALASFCRQHKLTESFYRQAKFRNHLDEAAFAALDLVDEEENIEKKLAHISHAMWCLSESLRARTDPDVQMTPPYVQSRSYPSSGIQRIMELTEMLKRAIDFCMENEIPFRREYNFVKNAENAAELGGLFLLYGADDLLDDLCRLASLNRQEITGHASVAIARLPLQQLLTFLMNMRQRDPALSQHLNKSVLKSLTEREDRGGVLMVIVNCFADQPQEQCCLFLEYGYVAEAFNTASASGMHDLIPLIGYRASLLGNKDIVETCLRSLTRM